MPNNLPHLSSDLMTAYAGRWIALVEGDVVGTGDNGRAAYHMGRRQRPKRPITVCYVPDMRGRPLVLSPLLDGDLAQALSKLDQPVYLVGGAVRDAVLGIGSNDLDFAVAADGIQTAKRVGDWLKKPAYPLDEERDVGRVVLDNETDLYLDFARFRADTLAGDLHERDFTINAMALPALARTTAEIIDPHGGLADLEHSRVRQVHAASLAADPIRGMRAVRMALKFGFDLDAGTEIAARAAVGSVHQTSQERVRDEWLKLLAADGYRAAHRLHEWSRLTVIEPLLDAGPPPAARWLPMVWRLWIEAPDHAPTADLRAHLDRAVSGREASGADLLRLAVTYHAVGKKAARKAMKRFRLSKEVVDHIGRAVDAHAQVASMVAADALPTARARHRYFRRYGAAGVDGCLAAAAVHLGTHHGRGPGWARLTAVIDGLLTHYFSREAPHVRPQPLIDGADVMAAGVKPGPRIGEILAQVWEDQLVGAVATREEALAQVRYLADEADG